MANRPMIYRGHVKNGVIVFKKPTKLPEGTEVDVDIWKPLAKSQKKKPTSKRKKK
ncbi:MAG TPA: hypothetical protein VGP94_00085 [Tepidisphaeraceae bacterium]|jgi:predicted DNA-binding antitoxin AbrB/MazE fold protein|nr:hypothetical protein [Tepidisphaeraceae bacterium]